MKPFNPNKEELEDGELRRGPWTLEEDNILIHHIALHGEGRWNLLAKTAGLKRTGKSCRLRWLNYLKPDIKRGNLTPQEQLVILELHSKWGNRWSKIAQHLPGRTDNEIKNYWRTRVQKQAKQLNMETNSQSFFDAIRCFYIPRLVQKIEQNSFTSSTSISYPAFSASPSTIEAAMRSSFPPAEAGVDNVDQSYKDYSSSSASQTSFYSSECSKALNPVEVSRHPSNPFDAYTSGDVPQSMDSSAVSSDNWYYMDTSNYDMKELPCISAMGQWPDAYVADHNWISNDVADATWNMDGLW